MVAFACPMWSHSMTLQATAAKGFFFYLEYVNEISFVVYVSAIDIHNMFSRIASRRLSIAFACLKRYQTFLNGPRIIPTATKRSYLCITGLTVAGVLVPPRLEKHVSPLSPIDRIDLVLTLNSLPNEIEREDQLLGEFAKYLGGGEAIILRATFKDTRAQILFLCLPYCEDEKDEPSFDRIAWTFVSFVKDKVLHNDRYKHVEMVMDVAS